MTAADNSGANAAAVPAAPSSAETGTPAAPSAKLDAAAELKAAEMAFDLGADGFVGKLDFMTRVEMEKVGTYCACYGVFSAYNKCSRFVTFR